jgi:hypothetical protein
VPSPERIRQWKPDHGSRSSRAGIFVVIVPSRIAAVLTIDPASFFAEVSVKTPRSSFPMKWQEEKTLFLPLQ